MGITIEAGRLTLECDEARAMFCRGFAHYDYDEDGFMEARKQATREGWIERPTSQGRRFICRECNDA